MRQEDVPFVALDRLHAAIRGELNAAFDRVVSSSAFTLGEEVARFEEDFAAYCGTRHCVGVASGTAALILSLRAMEIGPGQEVIVPAHTFIASALGVIHAGATPVFCDVEEDTGLISPDAAAAAVGPNTAAVIAVHLYGQCCDMDALQKLCARNGLALLEDAAQAHGAEWGGRRAGSFGKAAAFSFYPSKNLGALGDAGAICTDDDEIARRARALRHLGQFRKGEHELAGYTQRLDGLQAALLRAKLPRVDEWCEARRRHAARYDELVGAVGRVLPVRLEARCVYHLYPLLVPDRDAVSGELAAAGIRTGVHYSPIVPLQPPFAGTRGEFPEALRWAAEELSLPMFEHLRDDEIERVALALTSRVTA